MAQQLMGVFGSLASADEHVRIDSATQLLSILHTSQPEGALGHVFRVDCLFFLSVQLPPGLFAAVLSSFHAESKTANADVEYARNRLIRGLASSRVGARQGFAIALTGLAHILMLCV
jgi:hypothetical protein